MGGVLNVRRDMYALRQPTICAKGRSPPHGYMARACPPIIQVWTSLPEPQRGGMFRGLVQSVNGPNGSGPTTRQSQ